MRRERRALSRDERRRRAQALAQRVAGTRWFRNSRRVAGYLPVRGEMDLRPLMDRALAMGKTVYVPVLGPHRSQRLWFARYETGERLTLNRVGIPEPVVHPRERLDPAELDLVLVPLVAFDRAGNRLGTGGGFYDRTFGYLMHRTYWHRPRLIGVAYELQQVGTLPHEPWDVPLHGVATERHLYLWGHGAPGPR